MTAVLDATAPVDRIEDLAEPLAADAEVTVLVDAALADTPVARRLRSVLPAGARTHLVDGDSGLEDVGRAAADVHPGTVVVAVGGGAVMDRAKLVSLVAGDPDRMRYLSSTHRCGFLILPERVDRTCRLVAVPTTVGTGAEASRTACLRRPGGKRLIYSDALRPDLAVLDPLATETLPHWQLVEGALEALLRVASYYVGHHGERPGADPAAEEVVRDLVAASDEAVGHHRAGAPCPAPLRRRIAELSSATHAPRLQDGLAPFSDKCWPLANELSVASGARKLTALAAVAPEVWRRVEAGTTSWGSAERLERLWAVVRAAAAVPLPDAAGAGLARLMDHWSVRREIAPVDVDRVAAAAARSWAKGLPMLGGIAEDELRSVYAAAVAGGATGPTDDSERR